MSNVIEERILSMKFDGAQFLAGIDKSLSALDRLNKGLKLQEGTKGLQNIGATAAQQTSALSKVAEGVQHISDRFKALGVIGMAALSNITNQAIFAGQNLVKSLTLGPVIDGFREYETNLNSIQTILSNTVAAGTKLSDVTAALDELNHYSDQTIYNFSEMAKNIGTFTAAGVGLKPAVAAIKGIANLAALSGSNSQQASTAMYQLSQAISSGRVSLEDWNSVVNAGMGGTVFQRALAQNAEKMGTLKDNAVKLLGPMKNVSINGKSFRESITAKPGEKSWLTSDVLTRTLAQFTGDLTDAQLAAQGFNKEEIKAIQNQAKMAKSAATEVKTLTQLLNTIKESVGSGWAATWKTIFGDFPEAKKLFTNINNVLGGYVQASADARNKVLGDWAKLGGRTAIINAIGNSFKALVALMKPIRDAFREIFPATTGKQLADISKSIESFTKNLTIGGTTANNIKRTFAGFFAVLDIGWQILKQIVKTIFDLVGSATEGSGGFLNFTGNIGDFLVKIDDAIKKGDGLAKIFRGIGKVLAVPIELIKKFAGYLGKLFEGFDGGNAADDVTKFVSSLSPLSKAGDTVSRVWNKTVEVLGKVWDFFGKIGSAAASIFGNMGETIKSAFADLDFSDILKVLNTGLFAGLVLMVRQFLGGGGGGIGGLLDNVGEAFENLTGALGAMQNTLRAATLLQIAIAVGILAIAMNTLSKIDAAGLARASTAIAVMFAQLITALIAFEKISGFAGFAKMPFVAAAMILMATAINILASAVTKLAELDWNELAKGLTGVVVLLAAVVGAMTLMPNPKGLISTGLGLLILAAGIKVLVSAVTDLSGLSWEEMAKGLLGVGALLGALALFTRFATANKAGLLGGAGLLLLAVGVKILASALEQFSGFSWMEIGRGLVAMAGSLALITAALAIIPPTAPLGAAAVLIVALSLGKVGDALEQFATFSWGEIGKSLTLMLGALTLITAALTIIPPTAPLGAASILITAISLGMVATALQKFAGFSWEEIGKAMTVLAGSLLIIGLAVTGMVAALPGAAALLIVTAALAILTPVLTTLGAMSWESILKGLVALAGALTVIGLAAAILTPVIPSLIGLGAGIALLGAGLALAGAGVLLFSAGMAALAISGAAGTAALVAMVSAVLGLLPAIAKALGALVVTLAQAITDAAPAVANAIMSVLTSLLNVIDKMSPKIVDTLLKLLTLLLESLAKYVPRMVDAGLRLVTGILNGIAKNINGVVTAATNVIVAFLGAIGKNQPRIIDAGVKMIISFVNGLANSIRKNTSAMQAAGRNLAMAIIDGMTGGLASGVGRVVSQARNIASSAINAAKNVLGIHSPSKEFQKIGAFVNDGFVKGLDGNKSQVDAAFNSLKTQLSDATKASSKDIIALRAKLEKLTDARHKDTKAIKATKAALAQAQKEHKATFEAYNYLTRALNDDTTQLGKLANAQDVITAKLVTANEALDSAIKTRDDYNATIKNQLGNAIAPSGDETATDYITNLKKQVEDTKSLANNLQLLRQQGLNDQTYKELLEAGPSSLPFVKDLLQGGKAQIDQINALDKELEGLGTSLGKTASTELYQAAVDSAAGLVKGLQSQQAAIEAQMDKIATTMVNAIKKKLGIKSPSRVFAEVGKFTAQGLASGMDKTAGEVTASAKSLADQAVTTLKKSLSNTDKMRLVDVDMTPVIRPTLDLTDIQRDASKIGGFLPSAKLNLSSAYSNAADTAAAIRARRGGDDDLVGAGVTSNVSFTQNNYSPKAISAAETYRNTKNQLSVVKGALDANAKQS